MISLGVLYDSDTKGVSILSKLEGKRKLRNMFDHWFVKPKKNISSDHIVIYLRSISCIVTDHSNKPSVRDKCTFYILDCYGPLEQTFC